MPDESTGLAIERVAADVAATEPEEKKKPVLIDEFGKPTPDGWRLIGSNFRKEMPSKERPGRGGRSYSYIDARQVAARLDAVVGVGNWSTKFTILSLEDNIVECTLSVFGVSKADVGYSNAPDRDDENEPMKAAYSDAFKRSAVHFGIGRFLYES